MCDWKSLVSRSRHAQVSVSSRLLTYIDQFLFIEKGIRGGVFYISKRYTKANNKYITTYDPDQPSNFILYLDVNNLYGWAISQNLFTGCFQWMDWVAMGERRMTISCLIRCLTICLTIKGLYLKLI